MRRRSIFGMLAASLVAPRLAAAMSARSPAALPAMRPLGDMASDVAPSDRGRVQHILDLARAAMNSERSQFFLAEAQEAVAQPGWSPTKDLIQRCGGPENYARYLSRSDLPAGEPDHINGALFVPSSTSARTAGTVRLARSICGASSSPAVSVGVKSRAAFDMARLTRAFVTSSAETPSASTAADMTATSSLSMSIAQRIWRSVNESIESPMGCLATPMVTEPARGRNDPAPVRAA